MITENYLLPALAGGCGFLLGALLALLPALIRLSRLKSQLASADAEIKSAQERHRLEQLASERIYAERERTVREQLQSMLSQLGAAADAAMEKRERELIAKNSEQLGHLLAPMRMKLDDFRKAAEDSRKTNDELGVKIGEFFRNIKLTSDSFGQQARSFTDALTGANKKQGNWGEAVLAQALENCGLKKDEGYFLQTGSGGGIPDCQIADPASGKLLIVDAKMSWTKYEQAYRLPDGAERRAALKEHVASVKRHIDELAKADYPHRQTPPKSGYTYIPLTAMFVPCNAALESALDTEPALVDYALKRDVALVSPTTLFGFLILVSRAWSKFEIDRNSDRIYEEARKLVAYVDRFFKNLEELGEAINKSEEKYTAVFNLARLDPEGQCIKGPAEKIINLGARPEKELKSKTLAGK